MNGDQDEPQESVKKVEVIKYILKVEKLLLAAGLKGSIKIGDYYYFSKAEQWQDCEPACHALQIVAKNNEKYSEKDFVEEKKLNSIPKLVSKTLKK
jgi:hypothetical protein